MRKSFYMLYTKLEIYKLIEYWEDVARIVANAMGDKYEYEAVDSMAKSLRLRRELGSFNKRLHKQYKRKLRKYSACIEKDSRYRHGDFEKLYGL